MTPKSQGVVTATVFMTTDGQKFDDVKGAEAHQLGLNRRKAIRDRVKRWSPTAPATLTISTTWSRSSTTTSRKCRA